MAQHSKLNAPQKRATQATVEALVLDEQSKLTAERMSELGFTTERVGKNRWGDPIYGLKYDGVELFGKHDDLNLHEIEDFVVSYLLKPKLSPVAYCQEARAFAELMAENHAHIDARIEADEAKYGTH